MLCGSTTHGGRDFSTFVGFEVVANDELIMTEAVVVVSLSDNVIMTGRSSIVKKF